MGAVITMGADNGPPVAMVRKAPESYFEDGGSFWVKNDAEDWVSLTESQFQKNLQLVGFKTSSKTMREKGELGETDIELMDCVKNRRVSYAGPLAGWNRGVVHFDDTTALVTKSPKKIDPKKGQCGTLHALVCSLLDTDDVVQSEHFLGWWSHALRSYHDGRPSKGMCLALAGEAGCGKTLLKDIVRQTFGGKECNPYQWMLGRDNFNKELCEAVIWSIDDEAASTKAQDRLALGASIKQTVANSGIRFRGLHQQAITLNPLRRLVICVNTEPDRILVLPPLDDDIVDKMMILKVHRAEFPMPVATEPEKVLFWERLVSELPAFVHYLLEEHRIPDSMHGRFGVIHFCHPDIQGQLFEVSPEVQLLEFLERTVWKLAPSWTGTTTELRNWMVGESSDLAPHEKREVPQPAWLGKRMSKLMRKFPDKVRKASRGDEKVWELSK